MFVKKIIALISLLCVLHIPYSAIIKTIVFDGLTKTNEEFLRKLIRCQEKDEFKAEILEEDVQILKNLNLFFSVDGSYSINPDSTSYNVLFSIEEAKYLYPILSISGIQSQLMFQAGVNHINFRGMGDALGIVYQYYDRHSISLFYIAPRHKNSKTGHEFSISKYSTVEPLYFVDTTSKYNFDNYTLSIGGFYWMNRKLQFGLGGALMYEKYLQLDSAFMDMYMQEFTFNKYQVRFNMLYSDINQHFVYRDGIKQGFYLETIQTQAVPEASFIKVSNDFQIFKRIGRRGDFALRNKIGIATNNFSPFSPFVLDGFINVRGIGNRVTRGTAELIINLEYRHTVWEHKLFFLQVVGFTDYGALRQPGERLKDMFSSSATNIYTGLGFRLHSRFFYNTLFRFDYAINPFDLNRRGVSFGFGQFF